MLEEGSKSLYLARWAGAQRVSQWDSSIPPTVQLYRSALSDPAPAPANIEVHGTYWTPQVPHDVVTGQPRTDTREVLEHHASFHSSVERFTRMDSKSPDFARLNGAGIMRPDGKFVPLTLLGWKDGNAILADGMIYDKELAWFLISNRDERFRGSSLIPIYEVPLRLLSFLPAKSIAHVPMAFDGPADRFHEKYKTSDLVVVKHGGGTEESIRDQILHQVEERTGPLSEMPEEKELFNYPVPSKRTLATLFREMAQYCWQRLARR
jgi:hypothetical protein